MLGIPIKATLNMTPKGIISEIIVTLKSSEIQHLRFFLCKKPNPFQTILIDVLCPDMAIV